MYQRPAKLVVLPVEWGVPVAISVNVAGVLLNYKVYSMTSVGQWVYALIALQPVR